MKHALITGGTHAPIAAAIAAELRRLGWDAEMFDARVGHEVHVPDATFQPVPKVLHALVHCYEVDHPLGIEEMGTSHWQQMCNANFTSLFRMVRWAMPPLRHSQGQVLRVFGGAATTDAPSWAYEAMFVGAASMIEELTAQLSPHKVAIAGLRLERDRGLSHLERRAARIAAAIDSNSLQTGRVHRERWLPSA